MSTVVPFGKYKGQSVELLIADQDYCQWLAGQDWFRSRYAQIHTLVINYGAEPDETPEHNRMQARFLDDAYCWAVARVACPALASTEEELHQQIVDMVAKGREEDKNNDAEWSAWEIETGFEGKYFEFKGWDVVFTLSRCRSVSRNGEYYSIVGVGTTVFGIECKPSIGDDFPRVMRQITARPSPYSLCRYENKSGISVLLIDSYAGSGASLDQVRKMMGPSGIRVVLSSELEP